jgi:hypothetical protein
MLSEGMLVLSTLQINEAGGKRFAAAHETCLELAFRLGIFADLI